ncbi:MAG: DVU0298 family protein [Chloroflexota bacterium]
MNTRPTTDLPTLRQWLLAGNYEPVVELARRKKRALSLLTALTYDQDAAVSDHAVTASGLAAKVIAGRDPEFIRNTLLRLFWLVNDESGGIGWRAPELIGEILYNCPQFDQFFPMLISLLDLEEEDAPRFRAGTFRAIGRVAQTARQAMLPAIPYIQSLLDGNAMLLPGEKETALQCLEQLTAAEPTGQKEP